MLTKEILKNLRILSSGKSGEYWEGNDGETHGGKFAALLEELTKR